jgi:hypothetical protein
MRLWKISVTAPDPNRIPDGKGQPVNFKKVGTSLRIPNTK